MFQQIPCMFSPGRRREELDRERVCHRFPFQGYPAWVRGNIIFSSSYYNRGAAAARSASAAGGCRLSGSTGCLQPIVVSLQEKFPELGRERSTEVVPVLKIVDDELERH